MLEADADELHQVLRCDPDREPAPVHRGVAEVADANAGDAQPMLERVERGQRLAERLAHPVAGIGTHGVIHPDAALTGIEADDMVRGRKHHPFDPVERAASNRL